MIGRGTNKDIYWTIKSAWYFTQQNAFNNQRHFLGGPPVYIPTVPDDTIQRLNTLATSGCRNNHNLPNTHFMGTTMKPCQRKPSKSQTIITSKGLSIQRVWIAPEPNLFVGCHSGQQNKTLEQLSKFKSSVVDKNAFHTQIKKEFTKLDRLLQRGPRLYIDFQVLLDTTGKTCYIDLDRFHLWREKKGQYKSFQNFVRRSSNSCWNFMYQIVDNITTNATTSAS